MREYVIQKSVIASEWAKSYLGSFGLVHRLSDLSRILADVRVGEGAVTELIDRVLLFFPLAF